MARFGTHARSFAMWIALLVLLEYPLELISATSTCPTSCSCSDGVANCTRGNLTEPPSFGNISATIFTLYLDDNRITFLNYDHFKDLDNVQLLSVSNNQVSAIDNATFSAMPKLAKLDLSQNQLASFPATELCTNSIIQVLNLAQNRLQSLPNFNQCADLSQLLLAHNQVVRVNSLSLPDAPITLDLSSNAVTKLYSDDLSHGGVAQLILSNNSLREVAIDAWSEAALSSLIELDVSHNLIDDAAFQNLSAALQSASASNLVRLSLADNLVQKVRNITFPKSVRLMDLSRNKLERLEWISYTPTIVEQLSLRDNQLSAILNTTFSYLYRLQNLDLSGNKLGPLSFESQVFSSLSQLSTLDLSRNALERIDDADFFLGLGSLTGLYLSNQFPRLETVNESAFRQLSSLRTLDLDGNAIGKQLAERSGSGFFDFLSELNALRLDDNNISGILQDIVPMPALTVLSISRNLVQTDGLQLFVTGAPDLRDLTAANNSVDSLGQRFLDSIENLSSLDLRNNTFVCDSQLCYFSRWLLSTKVQVVEYQYYECTNGQLVIELQFSTVCSSTSSSSPPELVETFPMGAIITIAAAVSLAAAIVAITLVNKYLNNRNRMVGEFEPLLPESNRLPTVFET